MKRYTLFVKNDNTIWGIGGNETITFGDGSNKDNDTPTEIKLEYAEAVDSAMRK